MAKSCEDFGPWGCAVTSDTPTDSKTARRPRFWVTPLLAGCCFALGYGMTHRLVTLQTNADAPSQPEGFASLAFPGESLDSLRSRNSSSFSLDVDMAAIEAKQAAERKLKEEAEKEVKRQAELAREKELALQAPAEPAWTPPTWAQPEPSWTEPAPPMPASAVQPNAPAGLTDDPVLPYEPAAAPLADPVLAPAAPLMPMPPPAPMP